MTANDARDPMNDLASTVIAAFRGAVSTLGRIFLALMIVLAAGLLAVATAIAGLFLAAAAIVMRFTGSRPQPAPVKAGGSVTLDARQTARGWSVE